MSGLSNYTQAALLNWLKGTAMPAAPSGVYVGLFNGDPTDAGTGGAAVTVDSRVGPRVAVEFGAITTGNTIASTTEALFGSADANGGATHAALFDAAVGGNMLVSGRFEKTENGSVVADPQAWDALEVVGFPAGSLTFTLD